MTQHAVSFLEIKALDAEQRTIEGWASRVEPDRANDIVEPRGATFNLPLPLLLDHDHVRAVGSVIEAQVTDDGIRFKAKIAKVTEPGAIKDLCDSAWAAAKAGLRRAVSIGFRPLQSVALPSGGTRFLAWEWFELSMVSVPCAPGATIDQVKFLDQGLREQHGRRVVLNGADAEIAEAWRRWDAELPMTPEQMQLTKLSPTGERLMTAAEQCAGRKLEAKTVPAVLQRQSVAFKPSSDFGLEMLANDPGAIGFLKAAPSRDELYAAIEAVGDVMQEIRLRTDKLEKSGARFRGVYQRASSYRLGDQATHKGSLWTALGDVPEGTVPGEDPTRWQLAAKGTG